MQTLLFYTRPVCILCVCKFFKHSSRTVSSVWSVVVTLPGLLLMRSLSNTVGVSLTTVMLIYQMYLTEKGPSPHGLYKYTIQGILTCSRLFLSNPSSTKRDGLSSFYSNYLFSGNYAHYSSICSNLTILILNNLLHTSPLTYFIPTYLRDTS